MEWQLEYILREPTISVVTENQLEKHVIIFGEISLEPPTSVDELQEPQLLGPIAAQRRRVVYSTHCFMNATYRIFQRPTEEHEFELVQENHAREI